MYEDELGTCLVKLSGRELSDNDSHEIFKLLHTIGDFERIGDHAVNIVHVAKEMHTKGVRFSHYAVNELKVITDALCEILEITVAAFETGDVGLAVRVEPLEQVIDLLISEVKTRHIGRLQNKDCTIELGFIFSDILNNYERVSDHCSNIAVCMIQVKENAFDTHVYLNEVKTSGHPAFTAEYDSYLGKYALPEENGLLPG